MIYLFPTSPIWTSFIDALSLAAIPSLYVKRFFRYIDILKYRGVHFMNKDKKAVFLPNQR